MFFQIAKKKHPRGVVFHWLEPVELWASLDCAWHVDDNILYKGMAPAGDGLISLSNGLFIDQPEAGQVRVLADGPQRLCPLWYSEEHGLGNLETDGTVVPADHSITWDTTTGHFISNWVGEVTKMSLPSSMPDWNMSDGEVIAAIDRHVSQAFEPLRYLDQPVKFYPSGGIDTITCLAYLRSLDIPHELVLGERFDFTPFWCKNADWIRQNYWGYKQMHNFKEGAVLVSGVNGDENLLRNPTIAHQWLVSRGSGIPEAFKEIGSEKAYHYHYLMKRYDQKYYDKAARELEDMNLKDSDAVDQYIINRSMNDFQHWHLDHTLTFLPFHHSMILRLSMCLSTEMVLAQVRDAEINRQLIRMNAPECEALLSNQKNLNQMENLVALFVS